MEPVFSNYPDLINTVPVAARKWWKSNTRRDSLVRICFMDSRTITTQMLGLALLLGARAAARFTARPSIQVRPALLPWHERLHLQLARPAPRRCVLTHRAPRRAGPCPSSKRRDVLRLPRRAQRRDDAVRMGGPSSVCPAPATPRLPRRLHLARRGGRTVSQAPLTEDDLRTTSLTNMNPASVRPWLEAGQCLVHILQTCAQRIYGAEEDTARRFSLAAMMLPVACGAIPRPTFPPSRTFCSRLRTRSRARCSSAFASWTSPTSTTEMFDTVPLASRSPFRHLRPLAPLRPPPSKSVWRPSPGPNAHLAVRAPRTQTTCPHPSSSAVRLHVVKETSSTHEPFSVCPAATPARSASCTRKPKWYHKPPLTENGLRPTSLADLTSSFGPVRSWKRDSASPTSFTLGRRTYRVEDAARLSMAALKLRQRMRALPPHHAPPCAPPAPIDVPTPSGSLYEEVMRASPAPPAASSAQSADLPTTFPVDMDTTTFSGMMRSTPARMSSGLPSASPKPSRTRRFLPARRYRQDTRPTTRPTSRPSDTPRAASARP